MIFTVLLVLLVLWALGFGIGVGGNLVHMILVLCAVLLVVEIAGRARTA